VKRTLLRRRTPLRRNIERFRAYEHTLALATVSLRVRSGNRCELRASPRCNGRFQHRHHRLPRSAGGGNDLCNLTALCWPCHNFVHQNPALSYEQGWLVRRGR
jgi:5-methylcytosine-specific restriction endonuclease McrA